MNNNNTMNINGEEYVKKSSVRTMAISTNGLKYVICRGYYCGVHAGYLKEHDGNHCVLIHSRRLWSWKAKKGISLSAVALHGIDESCKLPNVLDEIWLGDVYEVIPCTKESMETIEKAKVREQDKY